MKSLDAKTEGSSKHKNQATYVLCTLFWLITILVLAILYFALFKPKEPDVEVQTIEVSYMYMDGEYPHISALNLSLNILVLLNNPNRAVFHYSFSTAFLYHNGAQLGYTPIPGGHVDEQEAIDLTVDLAPQALSLLQGPYIALTWSLVSSPWPPLSSSRATSACWESSLTMPRRLPTVPWSFPCPSLAAFKAFLASTTSFLSDYLINYAFSIFFW
ncbi:hypothetical protein L7F22_046408 [Adiantum nelumboides]|nr:hypothetical protein [Adiantum nelumboides]